ncbi:MAG TPA: condensation domain-containing protein, partial [Lacunisphaera sp.]|nr:condensation domain-containing protein [Lacunisphaera sp.]
PADSAQLREALGKRLPGYMVPAHLMVLESLPLTPNGKVNRKGLPAPEMMSDAASEVLAQTESQKALCAAVCEVVRLKVVGINHRFYEVGGDSIKAIQVASRLRGRGWLISIRDIVATVSLEECALRMKPRAGAAMVFAAEIGWIPLLPIQGKLLNLPGKISHYNQSQLLDLGERADAMLVQRTLEFLVQRHDMLRAVVRTNKLWVEHEGQKWEGFGLVDLSALVDPGQRILEETGRLQESFELEKGPLFKALLLRCRTGDQLFLVAHHLVIDGVSWRILLEDFDVIAQALRSGGVASLSERTGSFSAWAGGLERLALTGHFDREIEYWRSVASDRSVALSGGDERASGSAKDTELAILELDEANTAALFGEGLAAYRLEPNDVLLAALALALRDWLGGDEFVVELEGHGREELKNLKVDLSRVVGWFTSLYPVKLAATKVELGEHLLRTKEMLRAIPSYGLGYGALTKSGALVPEAQAKPGIVFNYLGDFDGNVERGRRKASSYVAGPNIGPEMPMEHALSLNAHVSGKRFFLHATVNRRYCCLAAAQALLVAYQESLEEVAAHCKQRVGMPRLSPSDFGLRGIVNQVELDQAGRELERVTGRNLAGVSGLREMTPVQEGMYYAQMRGDAGDAYRVQQHWQLVGEVEINAMQQAYRSLLGRHEMLRARIIHTLGGRPLQAFLAESIGEWRYIDCRTEKRESLVELVWRDWSQGFDLARDGLLRLTLVCVDEQKWSLLLSAHHIILDGWSMPILFDELLALYDGFSRKQAVQLTPAVPFSRHLDWLREQDKAAIQKYWLKRLDEMGATGRLPLKSVINDTIRRTQEVTIDDALAAKLETAAHGLGVSLNALTLTAWSLALRTLSIAEEVVVGNVTSGRSGEIEEVERMVGMCLSTLPFRIDFSADESLGELVQRVQRLANEDQAHSGVALAQLQADLEIDEGLFDHLYGYLNYPPSADSKILPFTFKSVSTNNPTDYALDVLVYESEKSLVIQFRWNELAFEDASWPERLLEYLQRALSAVTLQPHLKVSELDLLSAGERKRLLEEFNDTKMEYPGHLQVQELFEQVVDVSPERTALVFGPEELSYGELEGKANRLARRLREEHGVGPDVLVGICLERSLEMVVGILGILKAGGAYVPLDPEYPVERLNFMLEDSAVQVVLTKRALPVGTRFGGRVLDLDQADSYAATATRLPRVGSSRNLAYVIYTSGSTGQPKGV